MGTLALEGFPILACFYVGLAGGRLKAGIFQGGFWMLLASSSYEFVLFTSMSNVSLMFHLYDWW